MKSEDKKDRKKVKQRMTRNTSYIMEKETTYYAIGLSNTINSLLEDEDYLLQEGACKMVTYLSNMNYMPPHETTDTMLAIIQKTSSETLINEIAKIFHQLLDQHHFTIDINFELMCSILFSIGHHYDSNIDTQRFAKIPIYNAISLLNYMSYSFEYLIIEKRDDHPIKSILDRGRTELFFSCIMSTLNKCENDTFQNIVKLIVVIYNVMDPLQKSQVSPTLSQKFKTILSDERKIMFIQVLENGPVKNKLMEQFLHDSVNKTMGRAYESKAQSADAMERLSKYFLRCLPIYPTSRTSRALELYTTLCNHWLQSILSTDYHSNQQQQYDWKRLLQDFTDFDELIQMDINKAVDAKLVDCNLKIMILIIQSKSS
ncbi:hypothetical protein DFA_05700 [Cavenderia fasciculata]|uniref:Armadillo-like helical domain-containing protein n=1 Tax=Cavenderia fasciculata TaxID=261658 RepID=F4PM67_CACFS|nr:uncharacterized protein DFA_05700 [Cavenderia fasciculata]EGG23567.1 hypothetical protein DFA_05700 [Cavenderia fasciculata]|eukprot:XP_004361418.1 hypothetical protein DFA_05700 [Cavenderia fasciculata]